VLEGLGLQTVRQRRCCIEMVIPTKVGHLDRFEPPFGPLQWLPATLMRGFS